MIAKVYCAFNERIILNLQHFFIPFVDSRVKAIENHSGLMYVHYEKI